MPFSREEREMPVHFAATVASKFTRFKSDGLQHVEYTATEGVQTRITDRRRLSACVRAGDGHFEHCF